jgi:C2 domain
VLDGGIIQSDFPMNNGTAINGIASQGKVHFKMQFNPNKTKEVSFDGALETDTHVKGHYTEEDTKVDPLPGGTLKLTVIKAELITDRDVVGNMDPYCIIEHSGKKVQTKTHNNGATKPVWGDSFDFKVESMAEEVKFVIMDDDTFKDEALGNVNLKMSDLCKHHGIVSTPFPVSFKGKSEGNLFLESHYTPVLAAGEVDNSSGWGHEGTFEMVK